MRADTRKTWVSTGITSLPQMTAPTTLAVLRPTPGNRCKASRSDGTTPPNSVQSIRAMAARFLALLLG